MIERVSRKITKYYQYSLLLIIFTTLFSILYFWKLGFIDGSRSKQLHQAGYILETYQSKNTFQNIKKIIDIENPKDAIKKINEVDKDFEKIHKVVDVKEYPELKNDLQKLKKSVANLISFSKMSKVLGVFNGKMNKFYAYVKKNNWRTLSRMSDRVFSQTAGHVSVQKLDSIVKGVERDFRTMIKVTENSILGRKEKSEIVSRIGHLKTEISMLKKYSAERRFFYQLYGDTSKSVNKWLDTVAPELTLQKMKVEQIGRYYVMGMLGILFLTLSIFGGSFLVQKLLFRRARMDVEAELEAIIENNLVEDELLDSEEFSPQFRSYVKRMSSYIEKRKSFGSIFQDALPISSIMLDHNLKVVWANKLFLENWELSEEEIYKDYMSWDFLNKLTNIGHDDPILEALKNQIAGIYQIQVKPNENASARPYEMFVSPVTYKSESRIMLFFYDLTNLEQTIQDQAKGVVTPIQRTLDLMYDGQFRDDKDLAYEYSIGDINEIYDQFLVVNEKINGIQENLMDQIEVLNAQITGQEGQVEYLRGQVDENIETNRVAVQALKVFKNNVIGLSSLSRELEKSSESELELIYTQMTSLSNAIKKISTMKSATHEIIESFPKLDKLKNQIHDMKRATNESRSKLGHDISQLSSLLKRAHDPGAIEKLSRTLHKVQGSFSQFTEYSEEMEKRLSQLEVSMSKSQMIFSAAEEKISHINTDYEVQQLQFSEKEGQKVKKLVGQSKGSIDELENEIVESLQSIFQGTKKSLSINSNMREKMTENDQHTQ